MRRCYGCKGVLKLRRGEGFFIPNLPEDLVIISSSRPAYWQNGEQKTGQLGNVYFHCKVECNILIWPAVSRHLSTLTVSEIGKFSLESLRNIEVVLSLSLRGLTVICETKQNEKVLFMRLTQICAVRSELRDVTLKRVFIVSKRGKLYICKGRNCFKRLYQQWYYIVKV